MITRNKYDILTVLKKSNFTDLVGFYISNEQEDSFFVILAFNLNSK